MELHTLTLATHAYVLLRADTKLMCLLKKRECTI